MLSLSTSFYVAVHEGVYRIKAIYQNAEFRLNRNEMAEDVGVRSKKSKPRSTISAKTRVHSVHVLSFLTCVPNCMLNFFPVSS